MALMREEEEAEDQDHREEEDVVAAASLGEATAKDTNKTSSRSVFFVTSIQCMNYFM